MVNDTLPAGPAPEKSATPEFAPDPVQTIDIGETTTGPLPGIPADERPIDTTPTEVESGGQAAPLINVETSAAEATAERVSSDATPSEQVAASAMAEANVAQQPTTTPAAPPALVIDIGGTKVKMLATGHTEPRKAPTGKEFTPAKLVETARALAADWEYEVITIGYPGLVGPHGPRSEPGNLGPGWVGYDFTSAFGKPVKMINDAAMQALGSYEGGRMLFLGLGTGLGSTLITGQVVIPLELGRMLYNDKRTLGEVLGRRGLEKLGKDGWQEAVNRAVLALMHSFVADYIVIGGGNAKLIKELPPGARRGHNLTAFRGGFRLWNVEDVWVLATSGGESPQPKVNDSLRVL